MTANSLKWTLAALIVGSPAAMALGLGDIHLHSALNAPLDADIDLVGATPDDLTSLKARWRPARYSSKTAWIGRPSCRA